MGGRDLSFAGLDILTNATEKFVRVFASLYGHFGGIEAEELFTGEVIEGWYDLKKPDEDDDQQEVQGQILFSVQYIPKADLVDELANEIQNSYFEARENCRMTLYQDAETPQLSQFNGLNHPDGSPYVATRAWFDLYECIRNAKKFIYITGWSVYTSIQLIRGEEDPDCLR